MFVCTKQICVLHFQHEDGRSHIVDLSHVFDKFFAKYFPLDLFFVKTSSVLKVLPLTFV